MAYFGPPILPPIIIIQNNGPTVEGISRDIGQDIGGTTITIWGRGFDNSATVTFNGNNASILTLTPNTLIVKTPSGTASQTPVDVKISQTGGSTTLVGSFEYLPSPTTIYAQETFESSSYGALTPRSGSSSTISIVPVPFPRGGSTKCVQCQVTSPAHDECSVFVDLANNPMATQPNGIFLRWFMYIPSPTLQLVTGQIKLALMRTVSAQASGVIIPGIGSQFGSPSGTMHLFVGSDDGNEYVPSGSGGGSFNYQEYNDGNWIETMYHLTRNTGSHQMQFRTWVNGKICSNAFISDIGGDSTADTYEPRIGNVFNQGNSNGNLNVYVDEVLVANGYVDPIELNGSGSATSITSISRDTVSTNGNVSITINGIGFGGNPSVTFGGKSATNIVLINPTTIVCNVPPGAANTTVDLIVANSATLPQCLTYLPAPTTIWATASFDDGTVGTGWAVTNNWVSGVGGSHAWVSSPALNNTGQSLQLTTTSGDTELHYTFTDNSSSFQLSPGVFTRFYLYVPDATTAAVQGAGNQAKFELTRAAVNSQPSWLMLGQGGAFSGRKLTVVQDNGTNTVYTSPVHPDTMTGWTEIQIGQFRSGGSGSIKCWIDGQLAYTSASSTYGDDTNTTQYSVRLGLAFMQAATPISVYIDNCTLANGYIDP